jgi:ferric-dicitrate binding protein FerR (iron transport regulator)
MTFSCGDADDRLSAHLDGELEPDEARTLETHLESCETCRKKLALLREQDRELADAFSPLRARTTELAERAVARLRAESPRQATPPGSGWFRTGIAAAAGFLLAALIFQGRPSAPPLPVRPTPTLAPGPVESPIAHLALATGAIVWRAAGDPDWQPLATGAALGPGACVKTLGGAKGSLDCACGSEVRLNGETEVQLPAPRRVALRRGEIFTHVAHDPVRFAVDTDQARIEALGTTLDIAHSSRDAATPAVTTVSVVEGVALVGTLTVERGFTCRIEDGRVLTPSPAAQLLTVTRWVNELLALKGDANEEFQKRVNDMLALIGASKMEYLDESEIRALGDHCALPLTRYIESPDSAAHIARRRNAARILADVASSDSVADLVALLGDRDPEVRVQVARGLERLTGTTLGYSEEFWRTPQFETGADAWTDFIGRRDSPWRSPRGKKP